MILLYMHGRISMQGNLALGKSLAASLQHLHKRSGRKVWQGFAMWHRTVNSLKEPVSTYTSKKKQAKMGCSSFRFVGALWLLIANFGFLESGVITGGLTSLPMHCEYPCNPTPPQPQLTCPLYGTPPPPPPAEPTYGKPPPLPTQPEYAAPPPPLTGYVYGAPPPPFTPPYATTPQGNCQPPPPMQVGNYPPYPNTYGYQPYMVMHLTCP